MPRIYRKLAAAFVLALVALAVCAPLASAVGSDWDADGIRNASDNCTKQYNPDQKDLDGDGKGDVCDPDRDGDGQLDADDPCPDDALNGCVAQPPPPPDADDDGVEDSLDNCPKTYNPDQADADGDGVGDACDDTPDPPPPPPPPPPSDGTIEKFEPPDGKLYAGVDADQNSTDTSIEANTRLWNEWVSLMNGVPPAISHTFTSYDTYMKWDTDVAEARGATPLITWQTGKGTSPKTIANGGAASSGNRSDYVIMKTAYYLRTLNKPVFLRIDQEMNAHWFAWCAYNSDGTPRAHTTEDFKDMWRRMHIIFEGGKVSDINAKLAAEGMPPLDPAVGTSATSKGYPSTTDPNAVFPATTNVAFVFNPVGQPGVPNIEGNRWADYYPGDRYVDWVGQTTYDGYWQTTETQRFAQLSQFYQDFAIGHDKPYMMGEWGLEPAENGGGGDNPDYIRKMMDWQKTHPQVKALVYFSARTDHGDYRLQNYPNSVPVLADAVADPRFLRNVQ